MSTSRLSYLVTEDVLNNKLKHIRFTRTRMLVEQCLMFDRSDLLNQLSAHFKTLPNIIYGLGIDVNQLWLIGGSNNGTIFSDGKFTVKITENKKEATTLTNVVGKSITGINKVHFVGRFPNEILCHDVVGTDFYIIIQDLVSTFLSAQEKLIINLVGKFLSVNYNRIGWPPDLALFTRIVYNYGYQETHESLVSPRNTILIVSLANAISALNKLGVRFFDICPNCLGKDVNGGYVVFDFVVQSAPVVKIPVIS